MTARIRYILKGIGSVLAIAPCTDYEQYVPKKTSQERMTERWQRVGRHLSLAIEKFAHEQKTQEE